MDILNHDTISYDRYLEDWIPPLHPQSEVDLEPLPEEDYNFKHRINLSEEDELMETHFGDLAPLEMQDAIELIALISD